MSASDSRSRSVKTLSRLLLGTAVIISLGGTACSTPDPPEWKVALSTPSPLEAGDPLPTANQIVIYVDTSASMAGYVSKNEADQTVFGRTLQELRNLATILNPPEDIFVRHVDTSVGPLLGDVDLTVSSISPAIYRGRETDLAGAIRRFSQPLTTSQNIDIANRREGSSVGRPPRFQILVTDGVQSTREQRRDVECASGSDQVCVRKEILDLINKGWGACIFGLKSEFNGKVYSEINHTVITYRTTKHDLKTYRPFYLYVFSPDRNALAHLASVLRERLRGLVEQEEGFRELSLTQPYSKGYADVLATVPKDQQHLLRLSRPIPQNPARVTLRVDLSTEAAGYSHFSITLGVPWSDDVKYLDSAKARAELVHWELTPVYPKENTNPGSKPVTQVRLPELNVTDQQVDDEGRSVVQFSAGWPKGTGEIGWRIYHLQGRLNLEKETPTWVQQWSTNLDTTEEACNKTLNLESVLLGLWRNDVVKNSVIADAYIRVGPQ
jgi:hypothetical protein